MVTALWRRPAAKGDLSHALRRWPGPVFGRQAMILETESLHYLGKPWTSPYRVETRIRQENPGRGGFARGSRRLQRRDRQVRFFYTEICVCTGRVDHPRVARKRVQFGEDFVDFRCIANSPEHVRAHAVPGSLRKATAENSARLVPIANQGA